MKKTIESHKSKAVASKEAQLRSALQKGLAVFDDLQKSNPGWLGKLVLQDYGQLNQFFIESRKALEP